MYLLSSITGSVGSPSRSRRPKLGSAFSPSASCSASLALSLNSRELSPPSRLLIFADNYRTGDPFNSASPRPRHVREIDSKRPCSFLVHPLPRTCLFSQLFLITDAVSARDRCICGRLKNGKKLLAITLLRSTAEGLRPNERSMTSGHVSIRENAYEKHAQRVGTPGGSTKTGRFIP